MRRPASAARETAHLGRQLYNLRLERSQFRWLRFRTLQHKRKCRQQRDPYDNRSENDPGQASPRIVKIRKRRQVDDVVH
jgi:hypothetical protein